MSDESGRIKVILPEDISAQVRAQQAAFYEQTNLRVSLAEITRRLIERGLASNTQDRLCCLKAGG